MKKLLGTLFLLTILLQQQTIAQAKRNLLTGSFSRQQLQPALVNDQSWIPFPAYSDRERWNALPQAMRTNIIAEGEQTLNYQWQLVPATAYLEYVRTGNRDTMQKISGRNSSALLRLVVAELVEGKGRFLDQIINGVWAHCEMTTWSLSAHLSAQRAGTGLPDVADPIIDLGVGNTSALLAWTHYFFKASFDKVNPLIAKRIEYEINRQVLQPYYTRNDFWWMALNKEGVMVNNWNVWVNYNTLLTILLMENDPQKRADGIYKSMRSVDQFINYYKDDGACEEGPAYWSHAGGMLYNYLHLLGAATKEKVNIFDHQLIKNIGTYICKAYITGDWWLNYADAQAKLHPDPQLIYAYGKAIKDEEMMSFGRFLANERKREDHPLWGAIDATLEYLFNYTGLKEGNAAAPVLPEFWLSQTQIMAAKDKTADGGFYFSAIGGHNAESHNHNDVGTCILFYNNQPLLIDVGAGVYTRQTFGPERYTIWTMRSAYHNVPLINGTEQQPGRSFESRNAVYKTDAKAVSFSLDLAAAYPAEAKVKQWTRAYELRRGKSFSITDKYVLEENKGNNELHFMTSTPVQKVAEGLLRFTTDKGAVDMSYSPAALQPELEPIEVKDTRLLQSWPKTITRIILKIKNQQKSGSCQLIFAAAK